MVVVDDEDELEEEEEETSMEDDSELKESPTKTGPSLAGVVIMSTYSSNVAFSPSICRM